MPDFSKYGITTDILYALLFIAFLLVILWFLNKPPAPPFSNDRLHGKVRFVVDGDSLFINGHKPQIRLWGVDAPEKRDSGYAAATKTLNRIAFNNNISCQVVETDRYGRTVARCFLNDGQEINALMIASGTATEYRRFTKGFYSR